MNDFEKTLKFVKDKEARKKLLDKELVDNAYQNNSLIEAARLLGVGKKAFRVAMDFHEIPPRKQGTHIRPEPMGKEKLRQYVYRAYLGSDRCPPNCKGRSHCSLPGRKCILKKLAGVTDD